MSNIFKFMAGIHEAIGLAREYALGRAGAEVQFLAKVQELQNMAKDFRKPGKVDIEFEALMHELDDAILDVKERMEGRM